MKIAPVFETGIVLDKKYRIEKRIGIGGMGEVFEATHIEIGHRVAIKTLRQDYSHNRYAISHLCQEARLAGSIGHEHICQVTDIGRYEGGMPYLVMPLLQGKTLAEILEKESLTVERLVDIIAQVLSALKSAHDRKIVHRDLKPSNIFVTKVGKQNDFVKLLDFGISKIIGVEEKNPTTKTGVVPGTTYYLSPEQAMGTTVIDHSVDIYAIGVILYRALTGKYPFNGETNNEILYKIVSDAFTPPRKLNPNIPQRIESIIIKAMARDPMKRYRDAEQMRKALLDTKCLCPTGVSVDAIVRQECNTTSTEGKLDFLTKSDLKLVPSRFLSKIVIYLLMGCVLSVIVIFINHNMLLKDNGRQIKTDIVHRLRATDEGNEFRTVIKEETITDVADKISESVFDKRHSLQTSNNNISEKTVSTVSSQGSVNSNKKVSVSAPKSGRSHRKRQKQGTQSSEENLQNALPTKIYGPLGTEISLEYEN